MQDIIEPDAPHNSADAGNSQRPGIRERIAERTAAALSRPEVKARQREGLVAAWRDPEKRAAQAALTSERMAAWRARKLAEAAVVIQQLPKAERAAALAALAGTGGSDAR